MEFVPYPARVMNPSAPAPPNHGLSATRQRSIWWTIFGLRVTNVVLDDVFHMRRIQRGGREPATITLIETTGRRRRLQEIPPRLENALQCFVYIVLEESRKSNCREKSKISVPYSTLLRRVFGCTFDNTRCIPVGQYDRFVTIRQRGDDLKGFFARALRWWA